MSWNDNLTGFGILHEVCNSNSCSFANLWINICNLVTEFPHIYNTKYLNVRIITIHSESWPYSKSTSLSWSIPSLCNKWMEGLRSNQRYSNTLDSWWLLEAELINDVLKNILWDLEMFFIVPGFTSADKWWSKILREFIFNKLNLFCYIFIWFLQSFVFLGNNLFRRLICCCSFFGNLFFFFFFLNWVCRFHFVNF